MGWHGRDGSMAAVLRVLTAEDSEEDALLVERELRKGGFAVKITQVQDEAGMRAALENGTFDLVLSDWSMPNFSALGALEVAKSHGQDVPFIVVTGTVGDEVAVQALRAGAHDYVAKDRLARLVPAVQRELREAESRRARRRAEEEVVKSTERYRAMFAASPLPMWLFDVDSLAFLEVNDAAVVHYGYSREEFLGLTLAEIRPSDDIATLRADIASHTDSHQPTLWRHRKKNGDVILVEIKAHDVVLEERSARLVLVNDVTDRVRAEEMLRKTEEQLRQAQKMEAVGRLAGGVAHDFNNMLSVILSCTELLLGDMAQDDPRREDVGEIREAGKRAADLTRQLLMFSRQQVMEPKVLDVNDLLRGMDKMLQRIIGEDVVLVSVPERALGRVRVDPGSIEQVVMNLVVNARDAMPTGGKLTIETANVVLDEAYARDHVGSLPGPHVMLAVSDTGIGMDRETQARIFEPFFTTKEMSKGTGLGLSTVFGIVKQSGGSVWVYSEPGKGATFKVYLPTVERDVDRASPSVPPTTLRGTETILVVEDDNQVRAVATGILRRSGYQTIEARDPHDAIAICERYTKPIHLLLTDVVMPHMSGPELARRLAELRPDLRVLCMSGYTDDSVVRHGVLEGAIAYLQKPITPETLTRKVREVMESPRNRPPSPS
jgi:two-component system cell cycle sensor histidine kinase/response regulator CckA